MNLLINDNKKVTIIGAGFVGSSIAYALTLKNIAKEIVLIDVDKEKCLGEVLDIGHGISTIGMTKLYVGDYSDCANSDLIIITAGRNRKVGESRLDMASENTKIVKNIVNSIKKYYNKGCILIVSNPVDILTQKVSEWMGVPNGYVFGSGCLLDSSRFVRQIAEYLNVDIRRVNGYLIGEHGDHQVPVWSKVTVGDVFIEKYCEENLIEWNSQIKNDIAKITKEMGAEIIRTKGKTHYGIATCVCYLADAIINQKTVIASVSSPLTGEYGVEGVALSVPSVIGKQGIQQRIHIDLAKEEIDALESAVAAAKTVLNYVQAL